MFNLFKKDKKPDAPKPPEVMGLRLGCSFELDPLHLKLLSPMLVTEGINPSQVIEAVGQVDLEDTTILRFYTDDEAFLQVVVQGPLEEDNVIDVKLFHFFDTFDISSSAAWEDLLKNKIGQPQYTVAEHTYERVWQSATAYHAPVAMTEKTFAENGTVSETDQFVMLFERHVDSDNTESLLVSAEEVLDSHNNLSRCLVLSTGIMVSPSQITIHG